MLEIREQILDLIKKKQTLVISSGEQQEIIEYKDNNWILLCRDIKTQKETSNLLLTPKQALSKICDYYRKLGNIDQQPGYKQIYNFMKSQEGL